MNSKKICVDEKNNVAPDAMFGTLPISIYEQDASSPDCSGIKHRHSEAQISVVIEGQVKFSLADGENVLKAGEAAFFNCNRMHEARSAAPGSCKYICFKFNPAAVSGGGEYGIAERYIEPITRLSAQDAAFFDEADSGKVAGLVDEMCRTLEAQKPCYEIEINILLQKLWIVIYKQLETEETTIRNTSYSEKLRIDMLCDFIHKNYSEKITLDDIADAAHISKGECCRVFKRLFHTTPFQYLVYYRLNRSIELLTETDYSISEIAQHVGFCSSSYYTKCFRKEYNCVPHKYRQELHKFEEPKIKHN